jgi:hypothetical protein
MITHEVRGFNEDAEQVFFRCHQGSDAVATEVWTELMDLAEVGSVVLALLVTPGGGKYPDIVTSLRFDRAKRRVVFGEKQIVPSGSW